MQCHYCVSRTVQVFICVNFTMESAGSLGVASEASAQPYLCGWCRKTRFSNTMNLKCCDWRKDFTNSSSSKSCNYRGAEKERNFNLSKRFVSQHSISLSIHERVRTYSAPHVCTHLQFQSRSLCLTCSWSLSPGNFLLV